MVDDETGEIMPVLEPASMKNLLAAMLRAAAAFVTLKPDSTNPQYKRKYASLAAIQDAAFPALHKEGLIVLQGLRTFLDAGGAFRVAVSATIYHAESGESWGQEIVLPVVQQTSQGIGSTVTYGRRYLLMAMLGLAPDDDDDDDGAASSRGGYVPREEYQRGGVGKSGPRIEPMKNGRPSGSQGAPQPPPMEWANDGPPDDYQAAPVAPAGKGAKVTQVKTVAAQPVWNKPDEAKTWAVAQGAFKDEAAATARWETLRDEKKAVNPEMNFREMSEFWFNDVNGLIVANGIEKVLAGK